MNEEELMRIGFVRIETDPSDEGMDVKHFQLYEYYKGSFVRIIVSKRDGIFVVEHIYFNSPKSDELQLELFGTDLSAENVVNKIREHKKNVIPPDQMPESF